MHSLFVGLAAFGLWQTASAKVDANGNIVLQPVPPADLGLQRRDGGVSQINLQNQTSLLWGGGSANTSKKYPSKVYPM
jgi:hypothetical protein